MLRSFLAFGDESQSVTLDGLTIENRLDTISLYGTLDITKDKIGYERALDLKRVIDSAIDQMRRIDLPDHIEAQEIETTKNPFI